jgi:hypothetical protein
MPYNKASLIRAAEIKIQNVNETSFINELTYCDGSQQHIFDARQCVIPAAILRNYPFSLV